MHIIPVLLAVIAALTIIVAMQAATAIRKAREHKKFRRDSAELVVALIAAAEKEMDRRVRKAVNTAIEVSMRALLPTRKVDQNDVLSTLLFGTSLSPTGRLRDDPFTTFTNLKEPRNGDGSFSLADLELALGIHSRPRFGVGKDRFRDLARETAHVRPEDMAHIKGAGSADPLTDPVNPLEATDPVERTAADQVAGDGGVATEAEANAESQAKPLPADYAKTHNDGGTSFGRRRPSITVESADRPERG